ncbi:hypothetical protein ACFV2U_35460 [Streptomyces sp. NPDC059697]|uniref:hypothetical protein n=1 Tax=Streptomyces sp. NPDC059697 TaxID=3346912 RepID=UPI00369FB13C
MTGFLKKGLLDEADVLDGWCVQYGGGRRGTAHRSCPVCVLRRGEEHDGERFFAVEAHSAAEFFAALVGLADYNSRRPGRTKMFNVLLAEAGDPGHPAHAFFVKRYADLVEVSAGALREAVASGGAGLPSDAHTGRLGRVCGRGDRGRRTRLSGCYESPPTWRRS